MFSQIPVKLALFLRKKEKKMLIGSEPFFIIHIYLSLIIKGIPLKLRRYIKDYLQLNPVLYIYLYILFYFYFFYKNQQNRTSSVTMYILKTPQLLHRGHQDQVLLPVC